MIDIGLSKEFLEELLECVEGLYVIEEESKKVHYVNRYLCNGDRESYEGKKCYEAFVGKNEPCAICPMLDSSYYKSNKTYVWEYYDSISKQWFKIKNRLLIMDGMVYRVGNVNAVGDMMELGHDAVKEIADMKKALDARSKLQFQLEFESSHDKLTGLYNRNQYMRDLKERYTDLENVGILFFDLNNLKEVNDKYSHKAGDRLLCMLAEVLKRARSAQCRCYRVGGDEFVLVHSDCTKKELEECRNTIVTHLEDQGEKETVSCDVAIGSVWSQSTADFESLVAEADRRMYENKKRMKEKKIPLYIKE